MFEPVRVRGDDRPEIDMSSRIKAAVRKLFTSRSGSVAIQMALGLTTVIGVAGMGIETTFLVYKQRHMQVAADSAALSGVMALTQTDPRDFRTEARAVTASLGFTNGANRVTVTVNNPPLTGRLAGRTDAVEVTLTQVHDLHLMRLFSNRTATVTARAVALRQENGRFCFLALDPSAPNSVYVSNNAVVGGSCGIAANSSSETAVYVNNNAIINSSLLTHGNWFMENGAAITGNPKIHHGPRVEDPYADVQLPTPPACTSQTSSGKNGLTLNFTAPGGTARFCDGWDFMNNVTINLQPGVYFIDSQLSIKNGTVINGTAGVTIVVNGNYAIDLQNNARLDITAPTSGDLAGIAFFGKRDATSTVLQKFSNNTILNIQGAIYFPNQILEVDNNGTTYPVGCTHVIGRKIVAMNNAVMQNNCEDTGVKALSPPAVLVE